MASDDGNSSENGDSRLVDVGRRAAFGSLWRLAGGGWQTLVRLGATAVLARCLTPADFGVIALATLICGLISQLASLASTAGIVAKTDLSIADESTGFWLAGVLQLLLFGIAVGIAPLAAWFFETPAVTGVVRLLALQFLFAAIGVVPSALLTRRMAFGTLTIIAAAGALIDSGVAVALVLNGHGYIGVVWGMVIAEAAMQVAKVIAARWRPHLVFERSSFTFLMRYGVGLLGETITTYLRHNLDYVIVGKWLGTSALGIYSFAYRIPNLIYSKVAVPAGSVVFPMSAALADDDQLLSTGYTRAAQYTATVTFPILAGLAAVAEPAVLLLWGEQWGAAVPPMRLLCLVTATYCVASTVGSVFLCKDRPDLMVKIGLVRLLVTAVSLSACVVIFGTIVGVAIGLCFAALPVAWMVALGYRLMGQGLQPVVNALWPATLSSALCAAAAYAVVHSVGLWHGGPLLALIVAVPIGALVYGGVLRVVFPKTWQQLICGLRHLRTRNR